MNEREIHKILAQALDQGLLLSFSRQRHGWQIREPKCGPRMLTKTEIASFAQRLTLRT